MKLTVDAPRSANIIRAYTPAGFRIGQRDCAGSVIVSAGTLIENWPPRDIAGLEVADLESAFALEPEVLLIGSGALQVFPRRVVLAALHQSKIGCEVMSTGAVCR